MSENFQAKHTYTPEVKMSEIFQARQDFPGQIGEIDKQIGEIDKQIGEVDKQIGEIDKQIGPFLEYVRTFVEVNE